MNDAEIDDLLDRLDTIARNHDQYEYGLPLDHTPSATHALMRKTVRDALAAPAPQPALTGGQMRDALRECGPVAAGGLRPLWPYVEQFGRAVEAKVKSQYSSVWHPIVTDAAVQSLGLALAKRHAVYLTPDSVRKLLDEALAAAPEGQG